MSRKGIITTYLRVRKVVGRGFINIYPDRPVQALPQWLLSEYAAYGALVQAAPEHS
jgi:hypothetical protein